MNNKNVTLVLDSIFTECRDTTTPFVSLFSGTTGMSLFDFQYLQHIKKAECDTRFNIDLQTIIEQAAALEYPTFSDGKAGINWYYDFLYLNKIIDDADRDVLCDDNAHLKDTAIWMLKHDNYDFLHGAIGIAWHCLYLNPEDHLSFFEEVFYLLQIILNKNSGTGMFPSYDFYTQQLFIKQVNLGLSHGIPGILKFCIQCIQKQVCVNKATAIVHEIVNFLLLHTNADKKSAYFPTTIEIGKENIPFSRLAWCYGDLSIGYILYQAGIVLSDNKVTGFALEVLKHTTRRRSPEETMVYDAGICHGSAGVAHMYNKIWHYTKDPIFKEAADDWIQKTLDFAIHKDGIAGYKKYNQRDNTFKNDYGLLEGVTGTGLVLLSYITGDFSWDYCLMLND